MPIELLVPAVHVATKVFLESSFSSYLQSLYLQSAGPLFPQLPVSGLVCACAWVSAACPEDVLSLVLAVSGSGSSDTCLQYPRI